MMKCAHLGFPTGQLASCAERCGVNTKLKVFYCAKHGSCTIAKRGQGIEAVCKGCSDYVTTVLGVRTDDLCSEG